MAALILLVRDGLVEFNVINLQTTLGVFLQLVLAGGAGSLGYLAASWLLKSDEIKMIKESFFRKLKI